jgi:hypothetical protein
MLPRLAFAAAARLVGVALPLILPPYGKCSD